MAVASEQTHAIIVPLYAEPVAIIFHFMEPIRTGGNGLTAGRETKLKRNTHAAYLGPAWSTPDQPDLTSLSEIASCALEARHHSDRFFSQPRD
jgi:hypothetical protein